MRTPASGQEVTTDSRLGAIPGVQLGACNIAVPGHHEAQRLADHCPRCDPSAAARPVVVIDVLAGDRITGRYGVYRCPACEADWLCWWAPPRELGPRDRNKDRG
jgi:hypothetical protein